MKEIGFSASDKEVIDIMNLVKQRAQETKEPIGDREFETIVKTVKAF